MAVTDAVARSAPIVERLLDNQYAQDQLRDGVESLRVAYQRASKRRVKPVEDKKVRDQVRQAAASITEAGKALKTGRQKPKKRRGRWLHVLIGLGALGAAAAIATNEELMSQLKGSFSDDHNSAEWPGDGATGRADYGDEA